MMSSRGFRKSLIWSKQLLEEAFGELGRLIPVLLLDTAFCVSVAPETPQSSLWDTFTRRSVRHVCCSPVFPSVLSLGSASSAPSRPGLFAGFSATMKRSDFSCPCVTCPGELGQGRM
jgi:hypothetical protein